MTPFSRDPEDSLQEAVRHSQEAIREQARIRTAEAWRISVSAALEYDRLRSQLDRVAGYLFPAEGFTLYWLARHWPAAGRVVEIGSFKGRSTCWLATGCRAGRKDQVVAVDHFRGSPEHRPGGTHPDPEIAASGSTLLVFRRNVEAMGLTDAVEVRAGDATETGRQWREPIRLLFLDGDHSLEATTRDFLAWSPYLSPHGLVLFHDVGVWPGVTEFYAQLLQDRRHWRELARVCSLGIVERLA